MKNMDNYKNKMFKQKLKKNFHFYIYLIRVLQLNIINLIIIFKQD